MLKRPYNKLFTGELDKNVRQDKARRPNNGFLHLRKDIISNFALVCDSFEQMRVHRTTLKVIEILILLEKQTNIQKKKKKNKTISRNTGIRVKHLLKTKKSSWR